ncbi:hypothetical protein AD948_08140 [Acetobacter senegalensis]|uniref:Uracil-DNA glycosylase-like domain-containing protein n=2 Tax=Acetobacter senegalensis TaxID=446692 RepID=A0A149U2H6_9PROT|nr:hypothetical protein AD948_08140 [Acetobacter senegalensis]
MPSRFPWIGTNYHISQILIVGESHYGSPEQSEDLNLTRNVIQNMIDGTAHHAALQSIERSFTGNSICFPEKFWETVAFINFCPGIVDDSLAGRHSATRSMIKAGVQLFPDTLLNLNPSPKKIVFFSKTTWEATETCIGLPYEPLLPVVVDGISVDCGLFRSDKGISFEAINVGHPGGPFLGGASLKHRFRLAFLNRL